MSNKVDIVNKEVTVKAYLSPAKERIFSTLEDVLQSFSPPSELGVLYTTTTHHYLFSTTKNSSGMDSNSSYPIGNATEHL